MLYLVYITLLTVVFSTVESIAVCEVNIDCDSACIQKYGSGTEAQEKLTRIFQKGIYPFKDEDLFQFRLKMIRFNSKYMGQGNPNDIIQRYRIWMNTNYPNSGCINMLLTDIEINTSVLGVAYVNGKCYSNNVGFVRTDTDPVKQIVTLGHEIGHLLGLPHTCEFESNNFQQTCSARKGDDCNPIQNKYLMYPIVNKCSSNIKKLSPCSLSIMNGAGYNVPCLIDSDETPHMNYDNECGIFDRAKKYIWVFVLVGGIIALCFIIAIGCFCVRAQRNQVAQQRFRMVVPNRRVMVHPVQVQY